MKNDMKHRMEAHRARAWRVHDLASDFELIDAWQFDLGGRQVELDALLQTMWGAMARMSSSWLVRARVGIGRALGWDDHDFTRPIPGCIETSVAARMTARDRSANRAAIDAPSPVEVPKVKTVYVFADEALYEFSNDTIHGLLHVGRQDEASLAVYVKSRGLFSRLYMAAIRPFRHTIVYPGFIRQVRATLPSGATHFTSNLDESTGMEGCDESGAN